MHRYPTRFATMNHSFFPKPSADDAEYDPADDHYDPSDDYDAYASVNPYKGYRPSKGDDDAEYDPADDHYDPSDDYEAYASANPYKGYRPSKGDDDEYDPADDHYDPSDDYEAYASTNPYKGRRSSKTNDDTEYVPDLAEEDHEDSYENYVAQNLYSKSDDMDDECNEPEQEDYDVYCASTGISLKSYDKDEEYIVSLKTLKMMNSRRPVTRSMTRTTGRRCRSTVASRI